MRPPIAAPTESSSPLLERLTPRECEVIHWVCKGKSNWEIGQILGCRTGTVKKHLYRAYAKLGVENRLQVINLLLLKDAIESGSISDILGSAATRAVAFGGSVALALAEAMSDWDLTFDFL